MTDKTIKEFEEKINQGWALRVDGRAVERFVRDFGVLHAKDLPYIEPLKAETKKLFEDYLNLSPVLVRPVDFNFREQLSDFMDAQRLLRRAWSGDGSVIDLNIKTELEEGFELLAFDVRRKGEVLLETEDLWKFICFLFLLDETRGKTGVCANPNCPAPYFLKHRRTQKICEQGECVAWAQRQYALRWWNREGKGRRAKKRAKSHRRTKR
jgi:hypothetical protein